MSVPRVHLEGEALTRRRAFVVVRAGLLAAFAALASLRAVAQTSVPTSAASTPAAESKPASGTIAALPLDPVFDVVAIHQNNYDRTNHSHLYSEANQGQFRTINATAIQVIQFAYELPDFRILNAPDWSRSARYDIVAKSDPALADQLHSIPYNEARPRLQKMVQSLLEERFRLVAHLETRTLPVYDLVVAKGGVKLSPGEDGPKHIDSTGRGGSVAMTITNSSHAGADLAEMLYRYTGRVVVDKTGLTGNYTLALRFATDDSRLGGSSSAEAAPAPASDAGPSVFTALKEQLGLELKSGKGSVEVLVIERIDGPTDN